MIELVKNKSNVKFVTPLGAGEDGGYYIPSIDEEGTLTWVASKPDMPAIEPVNIKGADGKDGEKGADGKDAEVPAFIIGDVDLVDNSNDVYIEAIQDYLNKEVTFNFQFPEGVKIGAAAGLQAGLQGAEIFNGYRTNTVSASYTHAEGVSTKANGTYSHAEGWGSSTIGRASHAEGCNTVARADYSHTEGNSTVADGEAAHAEGYNTVTSCRGSHAEGYNTEAKNTAAHAEGVSTKANGVSSHAEGDSTVANGYYSHAEGKGTVVTAKAQHVQGKYNIEDTENKYAHIVGNGSSDTNRSNAHIIDWAGNGWFAGNVTVGKDKEKLVTQSELFSVSDAFYNFYYNELDNYILVKEEKSKYYDLFAPEAIVELEKDKMDNIEITPEDEGKFLIIQGGAVAKVAIPNVTEEVF